MKKIILPLLFISFYGYSQRADSVSNNIGKQSTSLTEYSYNHKLLSNEELEQLNYKNLRSIKNGGANILIGSFILMLSTASPNRNNLGTYAGLGFIGFGGLKISSIRIPVKLKPQSKGKFKK